MNNKGEWVDKPSPAGIEAQEVQPGSGQNGEGNGGTGNNTGKRSHVENLRNGINTNVVTDLNLNGQPNSNNLIEGFNKLSFGNSRYIDEQLFEHYGNNNGR